MSQSFPIEDIIPEVKEKLLHHPILILQAPPGAGKSTILPLQLLNEPWLAGKKILMLEPRRLAARSVAGRMASLQNENTGDTIGYRVRFENRTSAKTRIEVVTEGILTRILQVDNSLERVGLVIFDEFHERSLNADIALALCVQMQQILRSDLRILIMSATLDGAKLAAILGNAPIVTSEGRQHPVTIQYLNTNQEDQLTVRMAVAIRQAVASHDGDVLAFFPGAGEIQRTATLLEEQGINAIVHLLFGDLPLQKQQAAILPDANGRRKIILSTSIAETSLTIEGISIVVDSGYSRVPRFDPRSGLTRLETIRVTRDAADQRAGRAGRLGPGVCFRLWNEGIHSNLISHRDPEILDADLCSMVLELSQWGVTDINELTWITTPPAGAMKQAKELLQKLEALDGDHITERGKEMLRLPTHPRMAHMLLEGCRLDLTEKSNINTALATDIAALLEERDPLPKDSGTDLTMRLELLRKWRKKERVNADRNSLERIERVAQSWRKTFKIEEDNTLIVETDVGKLLAAAYPERIAMQVDAKNSKYRLANGRMVKLPAHDSLANELWLVIAHLDAGSNEGKIFLAAPLNPDDILHLAEEREVVNWDAQKGMLVAVTEKRIGNITIGSKSLGKIPEEQRIQILCEAVRQEGLKMLNWTEDQTAWQARVMSVKVWRPDEDWPDVNNEKLLETLEAWLAPYLIHINKQADIKQLELAAILTGLLPYEMQKRLDQLAPDKIKVPSGSMISLNYFPDGSAPEISVRLQEIFGLTETPTVNEGRNKTILHLLSPGYRPVQVTQDLRSFWENHYPSVRKELRIKYQKHHWPEDPWTAEAVRGTKKNLRL